MDVSTDFECGSMITSYMVNGYLFTRSNFRLGNCKVRGYLIPLEYIALEPL
jgi:hypothetical protein